ncbi:MAG: TIR domain-containing protein [Treponema sp.]|jgi:hypothetical protein|nr:TIR domain-containing protein [Treponema sp.]
MAYRNKTYVAFDGDSDIRYYNLMKAWKQNDNTDFNFYDAHDLNTALDTSSEETIKRRLRERMENSKIFVLLVGNNTKNLRKPYVRYEIDHAINYYKIPIVVVNLNGLKECDSNLCPPAARDALSIHIPFGQKILQYALDNWTSEHYTHVNKGENGAYYYKDSVYIGLGL